MTPIIKIEVDHMRHAMAHAFSERLVKMDECFQEAITQACAPDRVQAIVNGAAARYLQQAVEEEVRAFLLYGDGRKLVRAEVEKRLGADWGMGGAAK